MARILCNVAGGGKPLKGNAETGDVLAGKTFSNKQSNALTGSMPNHGGYTESKSWVRSNGKTYIRIPKGAYLTSANNGLDLPEVSVADNLYGQGEYNNNYSSGYNKGVSDADGRVNTSSASYSKGYNAGRAVGHSANLRVAVQHTGSGDVKCWVYLNNGQIGVWHQNANGVTKDAFNSTITI